MVASLANVIVSGLPASLSGDKFAGALIKPQEFDYPERSPNERYSLWVAKEGQTGNVFKVKVAKGSRFYAVLTAESFDTTVSPDAIKHMSNLIAAAKKMALAGTPKDKDGKRGRALFLFGRQRQWRGGH